MKIRTKTTILLSVVVSLLLVIAITNEWKYYSQSEVKLENKNEFPVDIQTGDIGSLTTIPGIGYILAERIVCFRQKKGSLHSINDLLHVKGIGKARLNRMKPYICLKQLIHDDNKIDQ